MARAHPLRANEGIRCTRAAQPTRKGAQANRPCPAWVQAALASGDWYAAQVTNPEPDSPSMGTATVRAEALQRAWRDAPRLQGSDILEIAGGPYVDVRDELGLPLGCAFLDPSPSPRLWLFSPTRTQDPIGLLRTRLERAVARRSVDLLGADAYRLCHGGADGVPGLYIDRFGSGLCIWLASPGLLPLARDLLSSLREVTGADTLAIREHSASGEARLLEWYGSNSRVRYHHGRLVLEADLCRAPGIALQTRFFEAHRRTRRWARGRGLDVEALPGGFGTQWADAGALQATLLVEDADAATTLHSDALRNNLADRLQVRHGEIDDLLRAEFGAGERLDFIALRVPAEVGSDAALTDRSLVRMREGLRALPEGALLMLAFEDGHAGPRTVAPRLAESAARSRRRLQLLEEVAEGADHPRLLTASTEQERSSLLGGPRASCTWILRVVSQS